MSTVVGIAAILATPIARQPPPEPPGTRGGRRIDSRAGNGERYVNGRDAHATTNGAGIAVENPATGERLATVPDLGRAEVEALAAAAREAQSGLVAGGLRGARRG